MASKACVRQLAEIQKKTNCRCSYHQNDNDQQKCDHIRQREQRHRPLEMGLAGISAGSMSSHHDDDDEDDDDGVNEACTQNKRLWEMKLSR